MTDIEELSEYFRRLNKSVGCLIEVRHHVSDLALLYPESKTELAAIDSLVQEALQDIAWVNTKISMECFHQTDQD